MFYFWTAASDYASEGNFHWCNAQNSRVKLFPPFGFVDGSPDNYGGEYCLKAAVNYTKNAFNMILNDNVTLEDIPCGEEMQFICEVFQFFYYV
jgi:hypothetical protein